MAIPFYDRPDRINIIRAVENMGGHFRGYYGAAGGRPAVVFAMPKGDARTHITYYLFSMGLLAVESVYNPICSDNVPAETLRHMGGYFYDVKFINMEG